MTVETAAAPGEFVSKSQRSIETYQALERKLSDLVTLLQKAIDRVPEHARLRESGEPRNPEDLYYEVLIPAGCDVLRVSHIPADGRLDPTGTGWVSASLIRPDFSTYHVA